MTTAGLAKRQHVKYRYALAGIEAAELLEKLGEGNLTFPTDSERAGDIMASKSKLVAGSYHWSPNTGVL